MLGLGVGVMLFSPIQQTTSAVVALALGAAPALAGLLLARSRHVAAHSLILFNWGAGGVLAALLTGGLAGPMAVWHLAPWPPPPPWAGSTAWPWAQPSAWRRSASPCWPKSPSVCRPRRRSTWPRASGPWRSSPPRWAWVWRSSSCSAG
uniref:Uncharacterized protein n=1 Tax=Phenylobacterium glaciei TaxID=2803784 RepID=A0A974S7V1_9CAUL|nr:hypothetical protein JKL49_22555 [Phenylobacterium glaciei]